MDHRSLSERYVKKHIRLQLIVYSLFSYFSVTLLAYFPVLCQHPFSKYMYIEAIQCKLSLYLGRVG